MDEAGLLPCHHHPMTSTSMPTGPLHAGFNQAHEEMRWDILDTGHTSRALIRITATIGWLLIAITYQVDRWWLGLPLLAATSLSLLHGRRMRLRKVADHLGRFGDFLLWAMPYPRKPQLHPLGIF